MSRTIAMILAGGRVDDLSVLTLKRPKSAVPFGGIYRIIDFPLTNLMRSGVDRIGILSQYRLGSLMDHVGLGGPWDLQGRRRGVRILPPYMMAGSADWYRGTADACWQNKDFIKSHRPDTVMVLSGDHVYRMDYRPLIRFHEESKADLTMAFKAVDPAHASRFGIATQDGNNRVTSYAEKPTKPKGNLASLTIYVFRFQALMEALEANARRKGASYHFYDDIIPKFVRNRRAAGYVYDGYWEYSRTLDEYYRASMQLVAEPNPVDLASWQVRTNPDSNPGGELVPARFLKGSSVSSSIVPGGCVIEGEVSYSVLSPKVRVAKGAHVVRSILMDGVEVGEGAVVEGAILDKYVKVGAGAVIGQGNAKIANRALPHSLSAGITVVGRETVISAKSRVGTNCVIYPDLDGLPKPVVRDGMTVR